MRIARYASASHAPTAASAAGHERLGIVTQHGGREMLQDAGKVSAARGASTPVPTTVMDLIRGGDGAMDALRGLLAWSQARADAAWFDDPEHIEWLTPVPPKSMIAAGHNFGRHKLESQKGNPASSSAMHSDFPTGFIKLGRCLVPHKAKVKRPKEVMNFDHEVEIAVIIGRDIDADSSDQAKQAIFGYTVFNDLSAREWQLKEMHNNLVMMGKNFPGFGPLGPYILTADEVPDPKGLVLWCKVNGEMRQHSDCRDLLFDFEDMVGFWAKVGLVPGDIISTGTPEGVALHRKPDPTPFYLKPGDLVEAGVDGIGTLTTYIV